MTGAPAALSDPSATFVPPPSFPVPQLPPPALRPCRGHGPKRRSLLQAWLGGWGQGAFPCGSVERASSGLAQASCWPRGGEAFWGERVLHPGEWFSEGNPLGPGAATRTESSGARGPAVAPLQEREEFRMPVVPARWGRTRAEAGPGLQGPEPQAPAQGSSLLDHTGGLSPWAQCLGWRGRTGSRLPGHDPQA